MKNIILMLLLMLAAGKIVEAQNRSYKGIVKNQTTSEPISGASITIKDSNLKTFSKNDGSFQFVITDKYKIIEINHLGYESLILDIHSSDTIQQILLKPINRILDEVLVSTGYQEIPIERTTGSFELISQDKLAQTASRDVLGKLEYSTTGIFFDKSQNHFNNSNPDKNLFVHGISSISSGNQPLIILDNFPYEGDINLINPYDIESVTILKDGSASSIWGARAGNGVIVITSKKPKNKDKFSINLSSQTLIDKKPNLLNNEIISSSDLIDSEIFLFENGYFTSFENNRSKPALSPVVEILIKKRNGEISDSIAEDMINAFRSRDIRHDFMNYVYQDAISNNTYLALNTSTDLISTNISLGLGNNFEYLKNSNNDRFTYRIFNQLNINKNFKVSIEFKGATFNSKHHSHGESKLNYRNKGYQIPYGELRNKDGQNLPIDLDYRSTFTDTAGNGMLLDWKFYPLDELNHPINSLNNSEFFTNLGIRYNINNKLHVDLYSQYVSIKNNQNRLYTLNNWDLRNKINRGTILTEDGPIYNFPYGEQLQSSNSLKNSNSNRVQLSYVKNLMKHNLSAFIGFEARMSHSQSSASEYYGYDSERLLFDNKVKHNTPYPVFANLATSENISYPLHPISKKNDRYLSFFSNFAYIFNNKYSITSSWRNDASNMFGVAFNDKWTPLWSLGSSWNISEEKFFKSNFIAFLKFRGSFGVSGNIAKGRHASTTIVYSQNPSSYDVDFPYASIQNVPNPLLRWEKVNKINFGVDLSLISNRLTFKVDVYKKSTKDLIDNFPIDPTNGIQSQYLNIANTKSKGIDLSINTILLNNGVKWNNEFLFSYNNNWIVNSYNSYTTPGKYVNMNGQMTVYNGIMAYSAYSYKWKGLNSETGQPQGEFDGEISTDYTKLTSRNVLIDDLVFHGSSRPLYFGNINNIFSYKNTKLFVLLSYKLGYFVRRPSINYSELAANKFGHKDFLKRWKNPGDENFTNVPSFVYPIMSNAQSFYENSEILVEPGDHIRLQQLRITQNFLSNSKVLKKLDINVDVNNIGFLWRKNRIGLDPNFPNSIGSSRTYSIGMNLIF